MSESPGRVLAVDHGSARIGLAVSDRDRIVASPLETYAPKSLERDAAFFRALVLREQVASIVIGLPVMPSGDESRQAAKVREFGAWLNLAVGLPVAYWDERYTSGIADDILREMGVSQKKRKERQDQLAARLILEGYLAAGCPAESMPLAPAADEP